MHRPLSRFAALCLLLIAGLARAVTPMVEGGADFTLFLNQDGTVMASGSDASGQLGQGRTLSTLLPVASKVSAIRQISSWMAHNLALRTDGTVWAWGNNSEGQLGDGTTAARSLPQQIGGLAGASAVAAGEYHSVAALQDGTVRTWGSNRYGQLGDGSSQSRQTPVAVSGLGGVTAVAAGHNHTLALKSDGTVWAWGGNYWGQLGNGGDTDSRTPVQVLLYDGTPLKRIVAIAAGHSFSIAIDRDGNALLWGYLYQDAATGQAQWSSAALYHGAIAGAKSVAAGRDHVLVLGNAGQVWSWGGNYYGQLGDGTESTDSSVTSVDSHTVYGLSNVVAIAAGQDHSLAVKGDGTVWRWGFTRYAPEEDPEYPYFYNALPERVDTSGASAVAAGSTHSLVLKSAGTVAAWGDNADGQLGDGALMVRSIAATVSGLGGVTQVAAGHAHSLALKSNGSVVAWGAGRDGQLGNGRRIDASSPVTVSTLTSISKIAAAGWHNLALRTDGTLWAWGSNYYGQLGDTTDRDRDTPVQVQAQTGSTRRALSSVVSACGGDWHSAAVDAAGTVWRWGYDYYDTSEDVEYYYPYAVAVSGLPAASAVACGAEFTLVLARDGTVWGWGNNYWGQMGDGTEIDSIVPSQVLGLTGVTAIAAGDYLSLALKSDGTVWRWGYTRYDATDGLDYYATSPIQVDTVTQIAAIGAGGWHSLALRNDGTVYTWGFNWAGQLADGAYDEFRNAPQLAVNSSVSGVLDLNPGVANGIACPLVVQADKSGSVDAVTAGFKLYLGDQTNCVGSRKRAGGGYQVFVAATHPASGQWFLLKGVENGLALPAPTWTQYLGGPLPVFAANAGTGGLDEHVQATLIEGVDTRQLAGFDIYVGYGSSAEEMLAANRVKRIFTLGVDGRPTLRR